MALECDVELGVTDQKFNLLMECELQKGTGAPPQIVCNDAMLEGLDSVQKIPKSPDDYVGVDDAPDIMVHAGPTSSTSERYPMIKLRVVKIDGERVNDGKQAVSAGGDFVLVGEGRVARVSLS